MELASEGSMEFTSNPGYKGKVEAWCADRKNPEMPISPLKRQETDWFAHYLAE